MVIFHGKLLNNQMVIPPDFLTQAEGQDAAGHWNHRRDTSGTANRIRLNFALFVGEQN